MPRRALGNVERRTWPTGRVTYRARWHDAAGKSQRASFDTRAEAEAFLAERFVELARGGSASMAGRRTTLAECWETWQAGRQVSLLARRREQSAWACWIEPHLGSVKPCDLRRSSVQAWVAGQARSGLAPRTVERNVAVLRSCLSPAVADGLIAANPAAKASAQRAPKSEERFLSADEVYRLVEAVEPPNYRSMVAFGVACGLRTGELVALQTGDLDLLRRQVTVRRTALADSGQYGPVESRAGEGRVVPIPATLVATLTAELATRHPRAPVWPTRSGGFWKPGNWRRDVWRPAVARAGLVPAPTPHSMRHTAVALWLRSGASLYEASRWAGHASTTTTEQVYGHLVAPDGKVSKELDRLLWPPEPVKLEGRRRRAGGGHLQSRGGIPSRSTVRSG
jgi:integrase